MSARFCYSCGNAVGPSARFCNACGAAVSVTNPSANPSQPAPSQPTKPRRRWLKWGGIGCGSLIGIFAIIIILAAVLGGESSDSGDTTDRQQPQIPTQTFEEIKVTARTIDYRELFRNNERYKSQIFYFQGTVIQVIENWNDSFDLRVNVGSFPESEIVYLAGYEGKRLLEDDKIEFVGEADGLERYRAIMGNQVTIPRLKALEVRLIGTGSN